MDPKPSNTTKVARTALDAYELAAGGTHPPDAWVQVLKQVYAGRQLENQLKHTCPKWAFSGLCNAGVLVGVSAGSCEEAATRSSARFVLRALELVSADHALLQDKAQLKRRVFGTPGSEGHRQPNGEVAVLLGLWEAGLVVPT